MGLLPKEKWARILVISCYCILGLLGIFLFFSQLISIILPFALALVIGWLLQSPIEKLKHRTGLSGKPAGFILVLVVIGFIGFVFFLLANQIISEAQRIFELLSENSENILSSVSDFMSRMEEKLPFIYKYTDREVITGTVSEVLKNTLTTLSSSLAGWLGALVRSVPDIGLFFVVFVIASFYFAMDFKRITDSMKKFLGSRRWKAVFDGMSRLRSTGAMYIKAYSIILFITFAMLFAGFIILRVNYATTLALVIALLDILPVIGTGTVLVPWALFNMMMGDYKLGIGLLVLFGVITFVREVLEPKIIGDSIGMHPLFTLISMYAGYKLFGIAGLLLLPPVLNLVKNFFFQNKSEDKVSKEPT